MCYRRSAAATVPAGLMRAQTNRAELRAPVDGAITYEKKRGAARPEAYPVDCDARRRDDAMRLGAKSMYDTAGVTEVGRRKPHRPIARLTIS
jgi:hypothetical protein